MSKHRNYQNYQNYRAANKPVDEVIPEEVKEEVMEVVDEVADAIDIDESVSIEAPEEGPIELEPLVGVVTDCVRLNIRKAPSKTAEPVCVVDVNAALVIDLDGTDKEWFKVYTETGVEGYCMRQYVRVSE